MFFKPNDKTASIQFLTLEDFFLQYSGLKNKYLNQQNVYLVEIAGRDSLAAVIKYCQDVADRPLIFIPSAIYHPGLYGDFSIAQKNVDYLYQRLSKNDPSIQIEPLIFIDVSFLFIETILKSMGNIQKKYGFFSPCHPCHLLLHLVRIPITKYLGISSIITGERIKHGDEEKLNQFPEILNYFNMVLKEYGINLIQPLYLVKSNAQIEALIGLSWKDDKKQYDCIFSKNYLDEEKQSIISSDMALTQLKNEFMPIMKKKMKNFF